jgi:hypothetical protein
MCPVCQVRIDIKFLNEFATKVDALLNAERKQMSIKFTN